MMMMRSIRGGAPSFCFALLLFLLLFIAEFQTSHAVQCIRAKNDTTHTPVKCPTCAKYECYSSSDDKTRVKEYWGMGCPHHFYEDCSKPKWSKSVDFVKIKDDICYWDGIVYYCSCGTESCLTAKDYQFGRRLVNSKYAGTIENPDWYCEKDDNKNCPAKSKPNPGTSGNDGPVSSDLSTTTGAAAGDANSGISNSIIKLAGIIMVALAQIY